MKSDFRLKDIQNKILDNEDSYENYEDILSDLSKILRYKHSSPCIYLIKDLDNLSNRNTITYCNKKHVREFLDIPITCIPARSAGIGKGKKTIFEIFE
jgi:hypothetical protein